MGLLREWTHRLRGTLLPGRRDADLEHELLSHVEWPRTTQDVVVSIPTRLRAPRGLRREAPRKPWTRSGISEAFRGWTTWRGTCAMGCARFGALPCSRRSRS